MNKFKYSGLKSYWYPVLLSKQLNRNTHAGLTLLNEPIVLFRDLDGKVTCLYDRCPHRSTPLSLGRMCEGKLECLYHGWQFGENGECVHIPSEIPKNESLKHFNASPKIVHEELGMIWVWMGEVKDADTALIPRNLFELYQKDGWETFEYTYDLDVPHELMIENLLDPAHVPFTHHGTLSKRQKAVPLKMTIVEEVHDTIKGEVSCPLHPERMKQNFMFKAPCVVRLDLSLSEKSELIQLHFCVPLSDTKMRIIFYFFQNWMRWANKTAMTRWLFKKFNQKIISQDIAMLQGQYKNLLAGANPWNRAVSADSLAMRYRQWLNKTSNV